MTRFRLLYAGSLYKTRTPRMVLQAFRRFLDLVPGSRRHVKFDFAGRPGPYVEELAKTCDGDVISYLGMLSHAEALRSMASADVNLILLPNLPGSENDTTTKVYECLGSGRPVLAAVPLDGAAAAVLRRSDGVWLCDPDDVDGMTRALTELYRAWLGGTLSVHRPPETLGEFTREYQTGQLAAHLDLAVGGSSAVSGSSGVPPVVRSCGTGVSPVVFSGPVARASLPTGYGVVA